MEEVKSLLKKMLAEMEMTRRLMEDVFHSKDKHRHDLQQTNKSIAELLKGINAMPVMHNPQAKEMLNSLMSLIPGGMKNG